MQWPKAKNILILVLLVANLCLLTVFLVVKNRESTLDDNFVESAVAALQNQGITIDVATVPREVQAVDTVLCTYTFDDYSDMAATILSKELASLESDLFIDNGSLAGVYYRAPSGTVHIFFNGRFRYTSNLTPGERKAVTDAEKLSMLFAQLSGLSAQEFEITSVSAFEQSYQVVLTQRVNGLSVAGFGLTVETDGSNVLAAEGQLMLSKKATFVTNSSLNSVDALFNLAKQQTDLTIEKMTLCYYPTTYSKSNSYTYSFVPSYFIETTDGNFYYLISQRKIAE